MESTDKKIPATEYGKALDDLLAALGVDDETVFAIDVQPDKAVVKHVVYTKKDNGVHSGDFWEEVIRRDGKH